MRHKPPAVSRFRPAPARVAQPAALHFDIGRMTLGGYTTQQQKLFTQAFQTGLYEMTGTLDLGPLKGDRVMRQLQLEGFEANASPRDAGRELARRICASIFDSRGRKS